MEDWGKFLVNLGSAIGEGIQDVGTHTARAAAQANEVSAQAQSAQGAFNQASANQANSITDNRIAGQYGYNSAMMAAANQFNQESWDRTAAWNEEMWERQAEFNREEAQKMRDWQEMMSNTQYQRAMADMENAGLNPILAYSQGGAGVPGGSAASVGGASMSSASSAMASGGLVGAESANVGNYTGQMEYMSGMLGLISTLIGGISTAYKAAGGLENGEELIQTIFNKDTTKSEYHYENGYGHEENGEYIENESENKSNGAEFKRYMTELAKVWGGDMHKAKYHYAHLTKKEKQEEMRRYRESKNSSKPFEPIS